MLAYGPGGGYAPLRERLAAQHGVEPGRVLLTSGALQGFVFYAEELLAERPGRVLVEAPTYDRPLKILARLGADVRAVEMDDEGLDPDALARELDAGPTSFLYTIPTFQNPSGRTLSAERRRQVIELVSERGVPVLEDDPYGLVRYEGESPPSLFDLEGGALVTYTSSYSKTVAPGLRVGWFVAAGRPRRPDRGARRLDVHLAALSGAGDGARADRERRVRAQPGANPRAASASSRRDAGRARARASRPRDVERARRRLLRLARPARPTHAGCSLRAESAGVTFVPGPDFFPDGKDGKGAGSARLAFSYSSPSEIDEGVSVLASSITD